MTMISKVTTGKIKMPPLVLLYGPDGIGKTTWASKATAAVFLGPEVGTNNLNVSRFTGVGSWLDNMNALQELATMEHNFKTVVVDTLDWLEHMCIRAIIGKSGKNLNTWGGGYGAGSEELRERFLQMIDKLNVLRSVKGMGVILLAHSQVKAFVDPNLNETYDRYELKLEKKSSALFREYCEDVLFGNYKEYAKKEKGERQTKTFSDGVRVVYTERRPAFDAKNRSGLPFEMSLDWGDYLRACDKGEPESKAAIMQRIEGLLSACTLGDDFKTKVTATINKHPDDVTHLGLVANRLQVRCEG